MEQKRQLYDFGDAGRNAQRDELVAQILACFPTTPVPDYPQGGFVFGPSGDEYQPFAGKKWTEVPDVVFTENYDVSPLIGFDETLRNYYLPAFMMRELTHNDFCVPTVWYLDTEEPKQLEANKKLTTEQKKCVAAFVAFSKLMEETSHLHF